MEEKTETICILVVVLHEFHSAVGQACMCMALFAQLLEDRDRDRHGWTCFAGMACCGCGCVYERYGFSFLHLEKHDRPAAFLLSSSFSVYLSVIT